MKKLSVLGALVAGAVAGLVAWRQVEEKKLRDDIWSEAEALTSHQ